MSDIRISGLTKRYARGAAPAVKDVSVTVEDGEFFVLLGPSGCGKTTLLRAIAGLETPDTGTVHLGDRDVTALPPRRRDLAMVFQGYAVFPHLTVAENIGFGLRMRKEPRADVDAAVRYAAGLVQLGDYLDRYPSALSGGQRQRVAVARAVAVRPSVLLMDEPLSNLDALLRLSFRSELKALAKELHTTIVYVTHDQVEALSLGDRVAVMRAGEIVQCGTPMEVYDRPVDRFVGGFLGTPPMNMLPGEVFGGRGVAGIRAENIEASTTERAGALAGRVRLVEPLGSQLLVTVAAGEQDVKILTPTDFPAGDGADVWLSVAPERIRWFDADTERALAG
ncbi:ABC transporter ATP-binding protein [Pseudonocardia oroxyli]|uniref:Carbohydrate ABC transporter ATP-binding protein, CUT1 family n=1 Tax=Pseudonocardia oroxyli TaxID=366584 RepID=A0A1G7HTY6_PSEOR|nr:ABC transporter ATP-binding protein [Pseudonocardia oroxyli]SDF03902.1 carbohydrate ABC transporter ATP-binding protein, CUT1 family [Pseudonocardia oroxyli]